MTNKNGYISGQTDQGGEKNKKISHKLQASRIKKRA